MTAKSPRSYHFASAIHWQQCSLQGAELRARGAVVCVGPIRPMNREPSHFASEGAHIPCLLPSGELLWRDDARQLHRLYPDDSFHSRWPCPEALWQARRLVYAACQLWAQSGQNELSCFEWDTLTRLATLEFKLPILDIASSEGNAMFALLGSANVWQVAEIHPNGNVVKRLPLEGLTSPQAFAYLKEVEGWVVLTQESHPHLHWYSATDGKLMQSVPVGRILPCFQARLLSSDGSGRLLLSGTVHGELQERVLVVNSDGSLVEDIAVDECVNGLVADQDRLWLASNEGMYRYEAMERMPLEGTPTSCILVTPRLRSTPSDSQTLWLRADAKVRLPAGTVLEITVYSTDSHEVSERILKAMTSKQALDSHKIRFLQQHPELNRSKTVFQTANLPTASSTYQWYSAPMFDLKDEYVWIGIELIGVNEAELPSLSELEICYAGQSLMDHLPSIYRRQAANPGNFLRSFVGILETTSQELDQRIALMGSLIHPATAPIEWLDYVADWLGLPWNEMLSETQKRNLVTFAEELNSYRGTRMGLEVLLKCLLGNSSKRFRIVDRTADSGFAVLGGSQGGGSTLPALLGGSGRWSSALDFQATLGRTRLPCQNESSDVALPFAGCIRIDIAAKAAEKSEWEPWMQGLLESMVPITARVDLRWSSPQAFASNQLEETTVLEPWSVAHLGTDAVTGQSTLPSALTRLSDNGPSLTTKLQ